MSKKTVTQAKAAAHRIQAAAKRNGLKTMQSLGVSTAVDSKGMDTFSNMAARMGAFTPSLAEGTEYILERRSLDYWLMLTLYRNHWIARRIVEGPAQDMTRAWAKLNSSDMDPDDVKAFDREIVRSLTRQRIQTALKWANLYGGGGCLIVIDGQEDILEQPLDLDSIMPGTYRGLITFDRWSGITPDGEICTDIKRPADFGLPEYYRCSPERGGAFRVHCSRILRFCGPDVPRPETATAQYWGISVLEVVYDEIKKRDNMSWAVLQLLFRAQILTQVNPRLAQLMSGSTGGGQAAANFALQMQAQNELLSNQSMLILPEEGKLESHQYTFGGVADVIQQFQLDIAGAARMPVSRLFGRTISGLGQTNDADEQLYEERIAQAQDEELRPQLEKLYPVISMSLFGEISDDLDFTFPSVRVLTEKEKAELAKDGVAAIVELYNAGIVTQKAAALDAKQLGKIVGVVGTNISDKNINDAEDEVISQMDLATASPDSPGDELDDPTETPAKAGKSSKGKKSDAD